MKPSPFHATQRVVESLPPWFKDIKKFSKDFRMVFRAKDDKNEERTQNTPEGNTISESLEQFMSRYNVHILPHVT